MPKITLYFPDSFDDPSWAGASFCVDAPEGDHAHGRAGEWLIGRHPTCDITIAARTISARHAALTYSYAANRWFLTDLKSTNGTRLNGEMLVPGDPRPVAIGDRLHLGPNPVHLVEDAQDTIGDDGPSTMVGTTPLDPHTGEPTPPPQPKTIADSLYLGASWLIAPSTALGMVYRLIILAIAALVVVLVMGGAL